MPSRKGLRQGGPLTFVTLSRRNCLDATKQVRQILLQSLGDFLDVHQRHVSDSAFDAAVVCPVQPAPLGCLFLVDHLFLADATNGAAKTDADVESHRARWWPVRSLSVHSR